MVYYGIRSNKIQMDEQAFNVHICLTFLRTHFLDVLMILSILTHVRICNLQKKVTPLFVILSHYHASACAVLVGVLVL